MIRTQRFSNGRKALIIEIGRFGLAVFSDCHIAIDWIGGFHWESKK